MMKGGLCHYSKIYTHLKCIFLCCLYLEYGDWTSEEIDLLKEGLHKYGRAWGKIYRVVGGRKTATQCKQFYDKFCMDSKLELSVALAKHSSMKVYLGP